VIGAAIESLFKPDTLRRGRVNQGFDHHGVQQPSGCYARVSGR
jgi:hypothetical protein